MFMTNCLSWIHDIRFIIEMFNDLNILLSYILATRLHRAFPMPMFA